MQRGACFVLLCSGALGLSLPPTIAAEPDRGSLRKALAFHASFDGQADADFARGDKKIYTASDMKRADARAGLHRAGVEITKGQGKFGDALRFGKNDKAVVFFQAEKNLGYREKDWSGTVSFWLRLYSNFKVWNPKGLKFEEVPVADRPLSEEVTRPPFGRDRWTHVLFTFANLNSGKADGAGKLYLDGKPVAGIHDRTLTFTWDPSRAAMMLGLNYIGLFDDLSVFDRVLTEEEVGLIYRLEGGIRSLAR